MTKTHSLEERMNSEDSGNGEIPEIGLCQRRLDDPGSGWGVGHGRVNEVRVWEGSLRMNKGCERRQRPSCIQVQVYSVWLEQMIGWGFRD